MVRCRATLYERDGAFQVYVNEMFPDGLGAAQLALEQLKARLEKEGLFDPAQKAAARIPQMYRCRHQQNRGGIAGYPQRDQPPLAVRSAAAVPGNGAGL